MCMVFARTNNDPLNLLRMQSVSTHGLCGLIHVLLVRRDRAIYAALFEDQHDKKEGQQRKGEESLPCESKHALVDQHEEPTYSNGVQEGSEQEEPLLTNQEGGVAVGEVASEAGKIRATEEEEGNVSGCEVVGGERGEGGGGGGGEGGGTHTSSALPPSTHSLSFPPTQQDLSSSLHSAMQRSITADPKGQALLQTVQLLRAQPRQRYVSMFKKHKVRACMCACVYMRLCV